MCIRDSCNTAFKKAQEIRTHLTATLDRKYEVAEKLAALYDFFKYQIIQSNIRKEAGPVEEILPMIKELQEVFVQMCIRDRNRTEHHGTAGDG